MILVFMEESILSLQHISRPTYGMDELFIKSPVYFVPEAVDEDIYDIAVKVEVMVIQMFREHCPAQHFIPVYSHILKEGIFPC